MTKTLRLTNDDLNELLSILNVALYDMDIAINESHDLEEVAALREHKAIIRQWIHRLSQMDDGDESPTEHTVRVHFIDGTERIVPAKDFHWHAEGAQSATALVDGREVPIYKRSEPEWGPLWEEQIPLIEFGDEHQLDETGTHAPDCRCPWCEPESAGAE